MKTESVIDFPKSQLCPDVWDKVVSADGMHEIWQLKSEVKAKIQKICNEIEKSTQLHFDEIHVTGSITSNSYTENADIDVHFLVAQQTDKTTAEQMNNIVKTAYKKTYVGKHPIEVYFQPNKFQDLMSVGCYDVLSGKWLVGPEFADMSFNPYSEYYKEIQVKSEALAKQIRNMVFSIYEIAVVMKKNIGTEFQQNVRQILATRLQEVKKLYDSIRQSRKAYSSPTSAEEALKWRSSRKWKIADASFKLFDKYGYLAILKQFIEDAELMSSSSDVDVEVVEDILSTVKKHINNADKLAEKEIFEDVDMSEQTQNEAELDEGVLAKITAAALLAIPLIMPQNAIAAKMKDLPKKEMHVSSNAFQNIVKNYSDVKVGKFSLTNAVNIMAWNLYGEAGNQSKDGKKAVASTVLNRGGGKPEKMLSEILKPMQYSTWNEGNPWNLKRPKSDADWKYNVPIKATKIKAEADAWNDCVEIASLMMTEKFKSTIGNRNSYLNKDTADASVVADDGWGTLMADQIKIGNHTFGYLPEHDGFKKTAAKKQKAAAPKNDKTAIQTIQHVVKKGDTLAKIAKANGTTAEKLAELNNLKNINSIKIGQKLTVPASNQKTVVVKKGDTLAKIAKANGTTAEKLAELNNLKNINSIKIGQKLKV